MDGLFVFGFTLLVYVVGTYFLVDSVVSVLVEIRPLKLLLFRFAVSAFLCLTVGVTLRMPYASIPYGAASFLYLYELARESYLVRRHRLREEH